MGSQHAALGISRIKLPDDLGPQQSCCAHLGDLHIEIHTNTPKKAEPGSEIIYFETGRKGCMNVFFSVS